MSSPEQLIKAFVERATTLRVAGNVSLASAMVIFYDYILTIPSEISIIRNAPLSLLKVLFFIPRYIAIVIMGMAVYELSPTAPSGIKHCRATILVMGTVGIISLSSISMTMAVKTTAVYAHQRMVKKIIWGLYAVGVGGSCYCTMRTVIILHNSVYFHKPGHVCLVDHRPDIALGIPAGHFVFDFTATLLLLYKACVQYASFKGYTTSTVLTVLIRYGVLHFILRDGTLLAIAIAWLKVKGVPEVFGPLYILTALTVSVHTRSFIKLRESLSGNDMTITTRTGDSHVPLKSNPKSPNAITSGSRIQPMGPVYPPVIHRDDTFYKPHEIHRGAVFRFGDPEEDEWKEGRVMVIGSRERDFPGSV